MTYSEGVGKAAVTWDEIKKQVEEAGGVLTLTMAALRDAAGAGKLGVHVRSNISRRLAAMGLGHVPTELPANQHERVRVYKRGTPVGDLIEAALNPGERNDESLLRTSGQAVSNYRAPNTQAGLRWAPSYEQELVMLFGMLLPYLESIAKVEESSGQFPDCVAVGAEGKPIRIEFELTASSFLQHGHDPDECDLIVCWLNDWPESPVPVLELKEVVRQRAPWAVHYPAQSKSRASAWDEAAFMAQATEAAAAMLEGIKRIVAQHEEVLRLVPGQGDREATVGVALLREGSGRIYALFARGFVDVDFTRLQNPKLQAELRPRLAPLGEKALTRSWARLSAAEAHGRELLLSSLAWLADPLEVAHAEGP